MNAMTIRELLESNHAVSWIIQELRHTHEMRIADIVKIMAKVGYNVQFKFVDFQEWTFTCTAINR